jgi:hypothetical protein
VWIATVRFPWVARKKIVLKENLLVFLMLFLMLSYSHVVAFEDWIYSKALLEDNVVIPLFFSRT